MAAEGVAGGVQIEEPVPHAYGTGVLRWMS